MAAQEMTQLLKLCHDRPELFNRLILNRPAYWSRQIELCRSVVEVPDDGRVFRQHGGQGLLGRGHDPLVAAHPARCRSASSRVRRRWCSAA